MNNIRIIRPTELAELLSVSKQTIWRLRNDLPPKIRIAGRAVGWRKSDIEDWLEEREETKTQ